MNNIDKLTELISKFPGIGPRQARRIVFFLLSRDITWIQDFAALLQTVKKSVHRCTHCLRHFEAEGNIEICNVCLESDKSKMMIVEKETDLENIKKLGIFNGRYFILGSLLPITSKRSIRNIHIDEFIAEVVRAQQDDGLDEIILALPVHPEGDHTADFVRSKLLDNSIEAKVTILGRGLSTGTELEYSDDATFKSAFESRTVKS